ncbi:hypothetical protein GYMLUDRAFT_249982 [Collybiopsis luxurians FD-317 M1]|uniref:Unplaced genomic scaffold GYMLUscaffold_74, whole genome shotgun sequence n=1 Tax=Collybiopsis luxurians FD-317 M1 TaxID=944289 RepID=A0A0D0CGA6_9AGAR|nr:hypothetical protein GYMLUDRAFT_249982 [Collybiopsis luxurians FD-317 M1]
MLIVGIIGVIAVLLDEFLPDNGSNSNSFFALILPFFNVLPNILISRLMLNLRTFSNPKDMSQPIQNAEGQQYSGLQFATNSFLPGDIGAPLGCDPVEGGEEGQGEE